MCDVAPAEQFTHQLVDIVCIFIVFGMAFDVSRCERTADGEANKKRKKLKLGVE